MYRTVLAVVLVLGALALPRAATSAGGMTIPSTGTIGTNGLFLACRTTTSMTSQTEYYDQLNQKRAWECGMGKRPHKGVDILGSTTLGTTPVYAAAGGEVMTAERGSGLGWYVVLRHGQVGANGRQTYTVYGHMGDCASGRSYIAPGIAPGIQVAGGAPLGFQGNDAHPSSCAERAHLHWEVRASDAAVTNVFLALPASPDFYTGLQLTNGDPAPATSVTTGGSGPVPTAPPAQSPTLLFLGFFPWPESWPQPPAWLMWPPLALPT